MRRTIGVFVLVAAIGIGAYAVVGNSVDRPSPILTSDAKSVSIEPTSATGAPFMPKPEPNVPPYHVVLVVQNHTSNALTLPMAALADTLTSRLTGKTFKVINPHNVVGVNQNRTAAGEIMPEASAKELASILGAQGVITASIQEFTKKGIGVPTSAYKLRMRMALSLADGATGETICGVDGVEDGEDRYLPDELQSDTATLYEGLMHETAAKFAQELLVKAAPAEWKPNASNTMSVYLGCNVLGADVQVDGLSRGTCPMALSVTPGVHKLLISYPPYYQNFERLAFFDQEGQTYKVVLQLTPDGEAQRHRGLEYDAKLVELNKSRLELEKMKNDNTVDYEKKKLSLEREKKSIESEQKERCELFQKQLDLADAMLERYSLSGEADDYVRKTIAEGTAVYWKNSFGRIAITEGSTDNIEFATPSTDAGDLSVPPSPTEIGEGLKKLLSSRVGR